MGLVETISGTPQKPLKPPTLSAWTKMFKSFKTSWWSTKCHLEVCRSSPLSLKEDDLQTPM